MEVVNTPHLPVRTDWLALRDEPVLDPTRPIVDAHHHLWDRQSGRYLLDDYLADTGSGHRVVATVYVQCRSMLRVEGPPAMRPIGEVEFANGVAAMSASGGYGETRCCEAIVGGADLSRGHDVVPVLETMLALSGGRLRGIRNPLAWHDSDEVRSSPVTPPSDLMQSTPFREGVSCLARYGLSLDVWVYHTQLDAVYELARVSPDVTVVVDHFGGPVGVGPHRHERQAVFDVWRRGVKRLASLPNVRMKLGGAGMPVFGYGFASADLPPTSSELAAAWCPWFDVCVDAFGAQRCMFESNFPVDKGMFSYRVLWNAFKRLAASASTSERHALFCGTATDTYQLQSRGEAS